VDQAIDRRVLPVKAFLLITDVANRMARHIDHDLTGDRGRTALLAGEDDMIGRGQRFEAAPRLGLGGEEGVDKRIRDAVANLVGVPLGHRLAGKNKIVFWQEKLSLSIGPSFPSIGLSQNSGQPSGRWMIETGAPVSGGTLVEAAAPSVKQDRVAGLV